MKQQLWKVRTGECLFCAFRPLFRSVALTRQFASTSVLGKSPIKSKRPSRHNESFPITFHSSKGGGKFDSAVANALAHFKRSLDPADPLLRKWDSFYRRVTQAAQLQNQGSDTPHNGNLAELRVALFTAYRRSGVRGIKEELQMMRKDNELNLKYGNTLLEEQKKVADLRYPAEWFPYTRARQRTIHLHVGPTNSGKTYNALKRLEKAKKGFYAGPLRLLAQEIYSRFTAQGIPIGLVTGDEVRIPDQSPRIISNTVEMVSINTDYDVGVIDEIQMIADPDRGWAWTRAFLGSRAQELHLCGEERAVPLIKELTSIMGDVLEIHRYQRLNPLKVENKSLQGDLRKLRKGDCVVAFSRINIHALKNEIEKMTGKRCAIVYGGLPAEIRTQQASLFNDPDNDYDYLVASDAIGMGLNLKCRRIIFQTLIKSMGTGLTRISIPEIKQIGGRAGRYRAANETGKSGDSDEANVGYVTSLEEVDLPYIHQALEFEPAPLTAAGTQASETVYQRIASYFPPDVSFRFIINRVNSLTTVHPLFFLCRSRTQLEAAGILDRSHQLSIEDRLIFMASPLHERDVALVNAARGFIRCVATNASGRLLEIPELNLEILEAPVSGNKDYLNELESLHKSLILYLWLSFRMGGVFTDRTLAMHAKSMVEERMMRALTEFSANAKLRKDASRRRQILLEKQQIIRDRLLASTESNVEPSEQSSDLNGDLFDVPVVEEVSSREELQNETQTQALAAAQTEFKAEALRGAQIEVDDETQPYAQIKAQDTQNDIQDHVRSNEKAAAGY